MVRYLIGHDGDYRVLARRVDELLAGRTVLPGAGVARVGSAAQIRVVDGESMLEIGGVIVATDAVIDGRRAFVIEPRLDPALRARLVALRERLRTEQNARDAHRLEGAAQADPAADDRVPDDFAALGTGTMPRLRPTFADDRPDSIRRETSIGSYRSLIRLDGADVAGMRRAAPDSDRQARRARTYYEAAVDELTLGNLRNARVFASLAVEHQPGDPLFVQLLQQIEGKLRA